MNNLPHILVVDDDRRIRSMLRRYLTEEGFRVSEAEDGVGLRAALAAGGVDLVLLDLMMPGEDGLSLARFVRQESDIPVIILTGKGDVIDRVVGLETGADDYIAKPFHLREVLARIRTVLRRAAPRGTAPASATTSPTGATAADEAAGRSVAVFEDWRFDLMRRTLHAPDGSPVALTSGEFALLGAFVRHPNRVLSRDQLMDMVKGRDWAAYDRTVDTQIVRLRRKIELNPAAPLLIKTVRGAGYIFSAPVRWS